VTSPVRRPAFLASVLPEAEARPAAFAVAAKPGPPVPLRASRPVEPPGPSWGEVERVRGELLEKVGHAVDLLRLQSDRLAEQARSDALEIGFLVARRILEAEVQASPEALFALVRGALKRAGESRRVAVRLHPEDVQPVEAAIASRDLAVGAAAVEVAADASLERGDVVVETDFGTVDGRLKTRFDELHRAAHAALEEGIA
jgi:flagellar assembly protein FliH